MESPKWGLDFPEFWKIIYLLRFFKIGIVWNLWELLTFHKTFDLRKVPRRPGDVVVITGGTRGIGLEVVKKLLLLNMHVVIGCRNENSGRLILDKFRKDGITLGSAEVKNLDLTSLESVRQFGEYVRIKYPKVHVIINNAGIMAVPFKLTKDGFESHFQVNYLSHFLLTMQILPSLVNAGVPGRSSRIVNVSSVEHYGGIINFKDVNMEQMYSAEMGYIASKLMQVVSTLDLNTTLAIEGAHVKAYAVHPGVVKTSLYDHLYFFRIFSFIFGLIQKRPEQGADGVVFAAISSKFEGKGGIFFANCKEAGVNAIARDPNVRKRLWDLSCALTDLNGTLISEVVQKTKGVVDININEVQPMSEIDVEVSA